MIVSGISGAHWLNSRCQLVTSGLGQIEQHAAHLARAQQQADRRDRLHRFAQAHLVGQDRRVPRIEKRDALELIRKRLERKVQRVGLNQRFERRLQDVVQPVFELDDVARRLDAGGACAGGAAEGAGDAGGTEGRRDGGGGDVRTSGNGEAEDARGGAGDLERDRPRAARR